MTRWKEDTCIPDDWLAWWLASSHTDHTNILPHWLSIERSFQLPLCSFFFSLFLFLFWYQCPGRWRRTKLSECLGRTIVKYVEHEALLWRVEFIQKSKGFYIGINQQLKQTLHVASFLFNSEERDFCGDKDIKLKGESSHCQPSKTPTSQVCRFRFFIFFWRGRRRGCESAFLFSIEVHWYGQESEFLRPEHSEADPVREVVMNSSWCFFYFSF